MMIPVIGFPGYYVDELGIVYSTIRRNGQKPGIVDGQEPRPVKPIMMPSTGYCIVNLHCDGRQFTKHVHELVLNAFSGPRPEGMVACHGNGNKFDNRLQNLRWGTRSENEKDKIDHGTKLQGERHHQAKLTEETIGAIRAASGTYLEIAQQFGISKTQVGNIRRGDQWTHVGEGVNCPFTIVIDSMEKHPWTFNGLRTDADRGNRPLVVKTLWRSLGATFGDYSIDGFQGSCHIERKSTEDAIGTILGWNQRRARFQRELANLASLDCAAVVVECTLAGLLQHAPARGRKSAQENAKILFRQVLAWQQDYRVPWVFCDGRRLAELAAFRVMERFWRKRKEVEKAAGKAEKTKTQKETDKELDAVLAEL